MANKYSDYKKNVKPDIPDLRDRMYEPRLAPLARPLVPKDGLEILDQGSEGACTGFGLAAVINHLYQQRGDGSRVSARMLYEMAKRYDEWAGSEYEGSSCRGAIRGWRNMGVCTEDSWPYEDDDQRPYVSVNRAKEARYHALGAYYRLRPNVVDFHSALNETGVLYASAMVHTGWEKPNKDGKIAFKKTDGSGHAFAIVGYDDDGFWVQNSWGNAWGVNGLALWSYEDWAENISDAWVVQLALPTPQIFDHIVAGNTDQIDIQGKEGFFRSTPRSDIAGHFVHLDDGKYHNKGRYWSNTHDVSATAGVLKKTDKYDHLLLYAHGGLNSPKASAGRVAAMKAGFKANGIYPFHFMYDTGVMEEIKDVLFGKEPELKSRMGGLSDWWDRRVENMTRRAGRLLWREMKQGAESPFKKKSTDGTDVIKQLVGAIVNNPNKIKLHVCGHSTGAILMAYLLDRFSQLELSKKIKVETVSLMAPAATVGLYESHFRPLLKNKILKNMRVYNLTEKLEMDDTVAGVYRKSLLKLVSRAFEETDDKPGNVPLLGMQLHCKEINTTGIPLDFKYSQGKVNGKVPTESSTHGGFDNDVCTLNDVLKRVLGKMPKRPFTQKELDY